MQIIELLNKLGYQTIDSAFYNMVDMWDSWYMGKVNSFHSYNVYNGQEFVEIERYTLGMAKTVCEDWANYIFNKDTKIKAANNDDVLQDELNRLNFMENFNQIIESAFADGTSAVTILQGKDGMVDLDYIYSAKNIFPITWNNGEIEDCCFASYKFINGVRVLYMNIHEMNGDKWTVSNRFFLIDSNNNIGNEIVFDDVATRYTSKVKRYFIFSPSIRNNAENNPMGIPIFANAIDCLKGIDTVYDSYVNEFNLGRKRIMASASVMHVQIDGNQKKVPTFDPRDTVFYSLPQDMKGDTLIKEIDMKLRVQEHKDGLQDMLNALSIKVGMGTKHYSFVGGAVTATEVKSTTDTLYNSMIKHETKLEATIRNLCESILGILGYSDEVSVEFDDSVIRDQNTDLMNNIQLLQNGIIGRADVLSWWSGMPRDVAIEQLKKTDSEDNRFSQSNIFENIVE